MTYKYGEFTAEQMASTKGKLRKKIFFLLVIADPKTNKGYENFNVAAAFENVQNLLAGYNELFGYPQEIVDVASYLEEALKEYEKDSFDFARYRKLVLDAGDLVTRIKEA